MLQVSSTVPTLLASYQAFGWPGYVATTLQDWKHSNKPIQFYYMYIHYLLQEPWCKVCVCCNLRFCHKTKEGCFVPVPSTQVIMQDSNCQVCFVQLKALEWMKHKIAWQVSQPRWLLTCEFSCPDSSTMCVCSYKSTVHVSLQHDKPHT